MSLLLDGHLGKGAHRVPLAWCLCLFAAGLSRAEAQGLTARELTELTLEELMQIEITTVSKHAEKLGTAPAAVFALTADDLRRAGSTSLPESLRLVPGLQVARVDAHQWAISARGFNDVFANKLLVLRDGRSLYTPLFSGVFWDVQDTILDDIDRIEVVRGPGATLWGANAVNGVINILTKPARRTQGLLVTGAAGTDPEARIAVRYGGAVGASTHFRVYGKYTRYSPSELVGGGEARDELELGLGGFRLDHEAAGGGLLTLQGDVYVGRESQTFFVPLELPPFVGTLPGTVNLDGANLLGRWTVPTADGGEWMAQAYVDYTNRDTPVFDEARTTADVELQRRLLLGELHRITVGAGFRTTADRVRNSPFIALNPLRRRMNLWSAFIQDDIVLVPRRWHAVLGTKLEHNDFTGWEVQPGGRLLWTPNDRHTAWSSIARAVRTPSRAEDDITLRQITAVPGVSVETRGNPALGSEDLLAYEAGYRFRASDRASFDLAVFYNDYSRLRTLEIDPASLPALVALAQPGNLSALPAVLTLTAGDKLQGHTHGAEVAMNAQLTPGWRVRTTLSLLRMHFHPAPGGTDPNAALAGQRNPRHQATLWSQHDLNARWQFDWILRFTDRLPAFAIPATLELDARIAYRPAERWEIALAGQNLLSPHHREFEPSHVQTRPTEVLRRVFLEMRYGY